MDLVAASKDEKFKKLVDDVLGQARRSNVYEALADINRKRKDLAAGRSYAEMSSEELDQYEALRATEKVLYKAAAPTGARRDALIAPSLVTLNPRREAR